mmetsp:Transcript_45642/g.105952  ORF Transcript_45642/g.105952 Transcript_45642/m.105952 type:complete len:122 (+) Transcript_45642:102-467(+)
MMAFRAASRCKSSLIMGRVPLKGLEAARFNTQMRTSLTGIKIVEEAAKAQESLYWAQEDERLLKKMLENNPTLSPEFQGVGDILAEGGSTADKVKLVFMKHGIPPINKDLISDIVAIVESK